MIRNPTLASGLTGWGWWTPPGLGGHESLSVSADGPPGVNTSLLLSFRGVRSAPPCTDPTQLWNANISVEEGKVYVLSYWTKATSDVNASSLSLMSVLPPYAPYASGSTGPVLFRGGGVWERHATTLTATATASDGRVGWFWANPWTGPDSVDVHIANVSLSEVRRTNPNVVTFDVDVGNLLFFAKGQDPLRDEPAATGWKRWSVDALASDGDCYFDPETRLLTVRCSAGRPLACWPGGIEAALDATQVSLQSHVVVDSIAVRFGASLGINGVLVRDVVVRNCDVSWIGGGVLTYNYPGRTDPVRYGNGIQFWQGSQDIEVYNNRVWQMYDTPVTNQGINCTATAIAADCAMRNISYHHNLLATSGMACVEIWYTDAKASMSDVRFENNICASVGDGSWSAAQRPDAAGRGLCVYNNLAATTNVSVRNNVFYQNVGFEGMIYMSQPWSAWASEGLAFTNNALYRTPALPPSPPSHAGGEGTEHWLVKAGGGLRVTAANFSVFRSLTGAGAGTVLGNPLLHGFGSDAPGAPVTMSGNVTGCRPAPASPLLRAGAPVTWTTDFAGEPIPALQPPTIGPYQDAQQGSRVG